MKPIAAAIFMAFTLIFLSCNRPAIHKLPGRYYRHWQNAYSKADDTLIIRKSAGPNHRFDIEKRTGYRAISNGKMMPKKVSIKRWAATWNKEEQVLSEGFGGRELFVQGDSITWGVHAYLRLK